MSVNPSEPASHQATAFNQLEHFEIFGGRQGGKLTQELKNRIPLTQRAARQLTDDEGMAAYFASFEELLK